MIVSPMLPWFFKDFVSERCIPALVGFGLVSEESAVFCGLHYRLQGFVGFRNGLA